jgi:hypothetical protein
MYLIKLMMNMIDIAIRTNEPMEGYVQDHARRTWGTKWRYTWGDD